MPSDPQLLRDFLESGDKQAFEALVTKYLPVVLSSALRRCGDRGLAEEAVQNAFAILARKARRLVDHPTLGGWLHRTAILEAGHLQRAERNRRRSMIKLADETTATSPGDTEQPTTADREEIDRALSRLRAGDRDILLLRFFEELSFREIGERLGKSEGAAQKQTERSLAKMRRALGRGRAALPCGLAAAFAGQFAESHAAPATVSKAALSSAGSVPLASLAINTILTMSIAKPAIAVGVALLLLWPITKVLQSDSDPNDKHLSPAIANPTGERTPDRHPGESGDALTAIPGNRSAPDLDLRSMGRKMARFKLEERAFTLKYYDGPPDPKSEGYPEYVADMDAFMKKVSAVMIELNGAFEGGGDEPLDDRGMPGVFMASMVGAVLGLGPDNETMQSELVQIFRSAGDERERRKLSLEDRDPEDGQAWDEGMKAWREELYTKLGKILSPDEIRSIKRRLGYQFMDSFSFGMSAPTVKPPGSKRGDTEKIAAELAEVQSLLAAYSDAEPDLAPADPNEPPIVVPDLDGLGTELAAFFEFARTMEEDDDAEGIATAMQGITRIIAATQVHKSALEQPAGAASLISDVLGKMVEATPAESESIDRIVLSFREDAVAAGLIDARPEDELAREQWSASRRELVESYKTEVRAAVAPERAELLEEILDDWNPLFDVGDLEQMF